MNIDSSTDASPAALKEPSAPWQMRTASGLLVNLVDPDPESVLLDDIAIALSHLVRFAGQVHDECQITVLHHTMGVFKWLFDARELLGLSSQEWCEARLYALLHDAPEAYTTDIVGPQKRAIEFFAGFDVCALIDRGLLSAIYRRLDAPLPGEKVVSAVKRGDEFRYEYESRCVRPTQGNQSLPDGRKLVHGPLHAIRRDWQARVLDYADRVKKTARADA